MLAHLFLNHLLDVDQAFINFTFNYYQQPLTAMTPEALVKRGLIPPKLDDDDHPRAAVQQRPRAGPAQPDGEVLWENAWAAVKSA